MTRSALPFCLGACDIALGLASLLAGVTTRLRRVIGHIAWRKEKGKGSRVTVNYRNPCFEVEAHARFVMTLALHIATIYTKMWRYVLWRQRPERRGVKRSICA